MRLLIDAGNTRIKWGVHDGSGWVAHGAVAHDEIGSVQLTWLNYGIDRAYGSSVAASEVRAAIERIAPCAITWVASAPKFGHIRNCYRNPAEQGADRWLAVLGAEQALPARDLIIACAGTALTVESLTAEGEYLGGMILPGHALMLGCLARGTAQLNRETGSVVSFPQGTSDALESGVVSAMVGAIERARMLLSQHTQREKPVVVLTGGGASRVLSWLEGDVRQMDNLVLVGLLRVATAL